MLAAAVSLDIIAIVAFHDEGVIRVTSEGYPQNVVSLDDLDVKVEERELLRRLSAE